MESKLGLNFELVNRARASAAKIADDTQHFIDQHTTVTVERAVCRLLGIDGVNDMDVPLPNVVVDPLMANSLLPAGAAWSSAPTCNYRLRRSVCPTSACWLPRPRAALICAVCGMPVPRC